MHKHDFQEQYEKDVIYDDTQDIEADLSEIEEAEMKKYTKVGRPHARRSVEEYLERKRLRARYKDLFDDYFGEKS